MKPYLTIIQDSFRMLRAQAIFWVTLSITILVAVIYLSIGFDEKGVTLFFGLTSFDFDHLAKGTPGSEKLYVAIFTKLIAEYWLAWIAVLLALISCGSIFPETMKEGSAGTMLTKKVPRLHVFITKFIGSLLFVGIQTGLFVLIVFIALRLRVGTWNPSIFVYLPLVLLVFTYLYSFMSLVAIRTKSVMTALILTLCLWCFSSIIGFVEGTLYELSETAMIEDEIVQYHEESLSQMNTPEEAEAKKAEIEMTEAMIPSNEAPLKNWYRRVKAIYTVFPKTGRTMDAGDRFVTVSGERGGASGNFMDIMIGLEPEESENPLLKISEKATSRHSLAYSIGTSLLFALAMLALAARSFCRQDL